MKRLGIDDLSHLSPRKLEILYTGHTRRLKVVMSCIDDLLYCLSGSQILSSIMSDKDSYSLYAVLSFCNFLTLLSTEKQAEVDVLCHNMLLLKKERMRRYN